MIHIDWLTVSQLHEDAPDWGATRRLDLNMVSGEIEVERVISDTVQASWDTSIRIRCAGGRVEVSGNPSKWGRLDAVVGHTNLWKCIDVYNAVLRDLGLPVFTRSWYLRSDEGEHFYPGATVSRVDLARNLVVGRSVTILFVNWWESQTWGHRLAFRRVGEGTVSAGNRNRRQRVIYDKGEELKVHLGKWRRSRALEKESAVAYLQALAAWAQDVGLVRDEIRLGTKALSESELRYAENWTEDTAERVFHAQDEIQTMQAGAMTDYRMGIYEVLIEKGYTERMAGMLQKLVHSWLHGDEWKLGLSQPTAYRYAAILRRECGLDLRKPSNVKSLAVCIKPKVLEARALAREDLPVWYDKPELLSKAA